MGAIIEILLKFSPALEQGRMVANPESWKKGEVTAAGILFLLVFIRTVLAVFGYELPLTDAQLNHISLAIIAIVGVFFPVAATVSTEKIGLHRRNGGGDNGVQLQPDDNKNGLPMQSNAETNSVNSGGKGLLGGGR